MSQSLGCGWLLGGWQESDLDLDLSGIVVQLAPAIATAEEQFAVGRGLEGGLCAEVGGGGQLVVVPDNGLQSSNASRIPIGVDLMGFGRGLPSSAGPDLVAQSFLHPNAAGLPTSAGQHLDGHLASFASGSEPGLPVPGTQVDSVPGFECLEEDLVFEVDFSIHCPEERLVAGSSSSTHQRQSQCPEALTVVGVIGEQVAQCPSLCVVLPAIGRLSGLRQGLDGSWGDLSEVLDGTTIGSHAAVIAAGPVASHFGHAFAVPDGS